MENDEDLAQTREAYPTPPHPQRPIRVPSFHLAHLRCSQKGKLDVHLSGTRGGWGGAGAREGRHDVRSADILFSHLSRVRSPGAPSAARARDEEVTKG